MSDPQQPAPADAYPTDAYPADGGQMGAIEVKASFFVLAFLLYLFPAKASINGSAELNQGWGVQVYPVPAGQHQVRVWCPYFFLFKMGDAAHVVDVFPGQATVVEWKCPWLIFLPGQWLSQGVRPLDVNTLPEGHTDGQPMPFPGELPVGAPGVEPVATTGPAEPAYAPVDAAPAAAPEAAAAENPAGWHPDPHGQAALRYWDGQQWTEHTSDGQPAAG